MGNCSFGYGLNYTTGGIPLGLVAFADARTVDFNGFLSAQYTMNLLKEHPIQFHYIPSTDTLQIYSSTHLRNRLTNGAALPTALLTDSSIMFHAVLDRTVTG